jgi:hypothetical protein
MAGKLGLLLREMIYEADRRPGASFSRKLSRGLFVRVKRIPEQEVYELACGRHEGYSNDKECSIVVENWPWQPVKPIEAQKEMVFEPGDPHWIVMTLRKAAA